MSYVEYYSTVCSNRCSSPSEVMASVFLPNRNRDLENEKQKRGIEIRYSTKIQLSSKGDRDDGEITSYCRVCVIVMRVFSMSVDVMNLLESK